MVVSAQIECSLTPSAEEFFFHLIEEKSPFLWPLHRCCRTTFICKQTKSSLKHLTRCQVWLSHIETDFHLTTANLFPTNRLSKKNSEPLTVLMLVQLQPTQYLLHRCILFVGRIIFCTQNSGSTDSFKFYVLLVAACVCVHVNAQLEESTKTYGFATFEVVEFQWINATSVCSDICRLFVAWSIPFESQISNRKSDWNRKSLFLRISLWKIGRFEKVQAEFAFRMISSSEKHLFGFSPPLAMPHLQCVYCLWLRLWPRLSNNVALTNIMPITSSCVICSPTNHVHSAREYPVENTPKWGMQNRNFSWAHWSSREKSFTHCEYFLSNFHSFFANLPGWKCSGNWKKIGSETKSIKSFSLAVASLAHALVKNRSNLSRVQFFFNLKHKFISTKSLNKIRSLNIDFPSQNNFSFHFFQRSIALWKCARAFFTWKVRNERFREWSRKDGVDRGVRRTLIDIRRALYWYCSVSGLQSRSTRHLNQT